MGYQMTDVMKAADRAEPAQRRNVLDVLLLGGMDWTNANPWFGAAGLVAMYILAAVLEQVLP